MKPGRTVAGHPGSRRRSVRRALAATAVVALLAGSVAHAASEPTDPADGSRRAPAGAARSDEARGIRTADLEVWFPHTQIAPLEIEERGPRLRRVGVSDLTVQLAHDHGSEPGTPALWEPAEGVVEMLADIQLDLVGAPDQTAPSIRGRATGDLGGGVGWRARATGAATCDGDACSVEVTVSGRVTDVNGEGNCGELTIQLSGVLSASLLELDSPTAGSLALRDRAGCELTAVLPEPEPEPEFGPLEWTSSLTVRGDGANGYATRGFGGGNPVTALDGEGVVMCYTAPGPEVRVSWVPSEETLETTHDAAQEHERTLATVAAVGWLPLDSCSLTRLSDGSLLLFVLEVGVGNADPNDEDPGIPPSVRVLKNADGTGEDFVEIAEAYTDRVNTMTAFTFADATIGVPVVEGDRIMVPGTLPQTTRPFWWDAPATVPFLLVSTDGGATWAQHLLTGNRNVQGFRGVARFENGLFAVLTINCGGICTQLWRSLDDGATWERVVDYARRSTIDGLGASLFSGHGHDPFNYLVFYNTVGTAEVGPGEDSDRTILFRIYRAPASSALPLDGTDFTRGTADHPLGLDGDATWEFVGGPFGDDGYEVLTVLETGTVALWGTTIFGGGSKVHVYLGRCCAPDED